MDKRILTSIYKGGKTAEFVRAEIAKRYGPQEASSYNPSANCFTFAGWRQRGYLVKKGEKAILSVTFVEVEGDDGGKVSYPKSVYLFARPQVEPAAD